MQTMQGALGELNPYFDLAHDRNTHLLPHSLHVVHSADSHHPAHTTQPNVTYVIVICLLTRACG